MSNIEKHELEIEIASLRSHIDKLRDDRFQHSEIYHKIERILSHYRRTFDYLEHFDKADGQLVFDYWWPDYYFPEYLSKEYPALSESEIILCCLIKLHFSVIEISILLECTRDNIYKKMVLICKKMGDITLGASLKELLDKIEL